MKGPPSDSNRPRISLQMTDEEPVREAATLMGATYLQCGKDRRNKGWLPYYATKIKGRRAMEMMKLLKPLMSPRRQKQIQTALDSHDPIKAKHRNHKLTASEVRQIRRAKQRPKLGVDLAKKFGVTKSNIYLLRRGIGWPGIK